MYALLIPIFARSISINLWLGALGGPLQALVMRRREPAAAELLTRTMKRFNSQPTAGPAAINRGVR
jgi:hypothetical protein